MNLKTDLLFSLLQAYPINYIIHDLDELQTNFPLIAYISTVSFVNILGTTKQPNSW